MRVKGCAQWIELHPGHQEGRFQFLLAANWQLGLAPAFATGRGFLRKSRLRSRGKVCQDILMTSLPVSLLTPAALAAAPSTPSFHCLSYFRFHLARPVRSYQAPCGSGRTPWCQTGLPDRQSKHGLRSPGKPSHHQKVFIKESDAPCSEQNIPAVVLCVFVVHCVIHLLFGGMQYDLF